MSLSGIEVSIAEEVPKQTIKQCKVSLDDSRNKVANVAIGGAKLL